MKKTLSLLASGLIFFTACNKHSSSPSNSTTVDSTYLPKLEKLYSYDGNGNLTADSSYVQWTFDGQKRIIFEYTVQPINSYADSTTYSYSSNTITTTNWSYYGSQLQALTKTIQYQGSDNLTDSTSQVYTNYAGAGPASDTGFTKIFRDAQGNDTLEINYAQQNNIRTAGSTLHSSYAGTTMTSAAINANGDTTSVNTYVSGNITSSVVYPQFGNYAVTITYTTTPAGGYYYVKWTTLLIASTTMQGLSLSSFENDSYTFDKYSRVDTVIAKNASGQITGKNILTYY